MKYTTTANELAKNIKTIAGNADSTNSAIQSALIGAVYVAIKYTNVDPFNQIAAIKGINQHGIAAFVRKFAPAVLQNGAYKLNNTKHAELKQRLAELEDDFDAMVSECGMDTDVWFKMAKKVSTPLDFSADSYLENVIKHLDKKGASAYAKLIRDAKAAFERNVEVVAAGV